MKKDKVAFTTFLIRGGLSLLIGCAGLCWCAPSVFGQDNKPVVSTEVDDSFRSAKDVENGRHGSKTTTYIEGENGEHIVKVEYKDGLGGVKNAKTETVFKDGSKTTTLEVELCGGERTKSESTYDPSGKEISESFEDIRNGVIDFGSKTDHVKQTFQVYDSHTGRYEERSYAESMKMRRLTEDKKKARSLSCPSEIRKNEVSGGFTIIREDDDPERFNTYGLWVAYTHYLNSSVGLTANLDATFRQRFGEDLSKSSVLGGVTVLPFNGAKTADKVTISTHALFGVAHFKADDGITDFTENAFTMRLGGALDVNVTKRFFVRPIQLDYAPTFFGDSTQHNLQFSFGAGFRF